MNHKPKKKIAIIGGGAAGLCSALLLQEDYDITLFERDDYWGGQACTIMVPEGNGKVPIEAGAEFICKSLFPEFIRLLAWLKVPTDTFASRYAFIDIRTDFQVKLPPIEREGIFWHSLSPHAVATMLQLRTVLEHAQPLMATKDTGITLHDFADAINLTPTFKEEFLYPFFAAGWGVTPAQMKTFSAYDILSWAVNNHGAGLNAPTWMEVVGGMAAYIAAVIKKLTKCTLLLSHEVTTLAYKDNAYWLSANGKECGTYDHIIFATPAVVTHSILKTTNVGQKARDILAQVQYFPTIIAIHGDVRMMQPVPKPWSVATVLYDGTNSALTTHKEWRSDKPLFRTWITHPVGLPKDGLEPVYAMKHFHHPKVTPAYFVAQKELEKEQGKNNIWFAGFYTHGLDSHNSAIVSAMNIAQKIAPDNEVLKILVD